MTIILFLVVLAVLIFVHELGHFLVAKKSGIRVDEFAIGFPPKIIGWVKGETKYVLNLIPFGGYVKIFGENPDDESMTGADSKRSFVNAKKWKQVCVLLAGIAFNIIFAWLLISVSFMFGSLVPVGEGTNNVYARYTTNPQVVLTGVIKDSPAARSGLMQGDNLLLVQGIGGENLNTAKVRELIEVSANSELTIIYQRNGDTRKALVYPEFNKESGKRVIGIYMENVGTVKLNPFLALWEGAKLTLITIKDVAVGLGTFIGQSVQGKGDFTQVSGPVGIVSLVGNAANFGIAYFLGFVAFISLNLAVINLIPFPALDGGRVLFVIIEAIMRKPIKPKIANTLNSVGFIVLIILMLVITYRDIMKFF